MNNTKPILVGLVIQLPVCIAHSAPPVSGSAHLILAAFQALLPKVMLQITTRLTWC